MKKEDALTESLSLEDCTTIKMIPNKDTNNPDNFFNEKLSSCKLTARNKVKNEDVDERIVEDATVVYDKAELPAKFATNHKTQNSRLSLIVSLVALFSVEEEDKVEEVAVTKGKISGKDSFE